jgi:catechol 2,3-dioxygenase-like lactoylglutathione lyase family enzyme
MSKNVLKTSIDHINLTVRNFEESAIWYGKLFGFEIVERGADEEGPWGILRNGDVMLCIYERPLRENARSDASNRFHKINHFGLRIQDRKTWERTLRDHDIHTYYGDSVKYPHSTSWYVADPTGHMIEVVLWDGDQIRF